MHGRFNPFEPASKVTFDVTQIRPVFNSPGGLAKCSCYEAVGGWRKFCPLFERFGSFYQCAHGGGTMAGDQCVPYYRYLHEVKAFDEKLAAVEARFWENPEWIGIRFDNGKPAWENMIKDNE